MVPRKGAAFSVLRPGGLPAESHYRQLKTLKPTSAEYKRMTRQVACCMGVPMRILKAACTPIFKAFSGLV